MSTVGAGVETGMAGRFIEALRSLERNGDPDPLAELYAEDARAGNVQRPDSFQGRDGAREFWLTYRSTFGELESEFRTVVSSDTAAALEWTTSGTVGGNPVRYEGVTVLQLDGGSIVRSCAYFDPSRLGREALRASTAASTTEPSPGGGAGAAGEAGAAQESDAGSGGVDARPMPEEDGWRTDPEEVG